MTKATIEQLISWQHTLQNTCRYYCNGDFHSVDCKIENCRDKWKIEAIDELIENRVLINKIENKIVTLKEKAKDFSGLYHAGRRQVFEILLNLIKMERHKVTQKKYFSLKEQLEREKIEKEHKDSYDYAMSKLLGCP